MTNLTESTFYPTIADTEGVSAVQFTATWCGPCRFLTPTMERLADNYELSYFKVDVDENSELARNFQIMSVPTVLWYKNGELARTTVGMKSYAELESIVSSI